MYCHTTIVGIPYTTVPDIPLCDKKKMYVKVFFTSDTGPKEPRLACASGMGILLALPFDLKS